MADLNGYKISELIGASLADLDEKDLLYLVDFDIHDQPISKSVKLGLIKQFIGNIAKTISACIQVTKPTDLTDQNYNYDLIFELYTTRDITDQTTPVLSYDTRVITNRANVFLWNTTNANFVRMDSIPNNTGLDSSYDDYGIFVYCGSLNFTTVYYGRYKWHNNTTDTDTPWYPMQYPNSYAYLGSNYLRLKDIINRLNLQFEEVVTSLADKVRYYIGKQIVVFDNSISSTLAIRNPSYISDGSTDVGLDNLTERTWELHVRCGSNITEYDFGSNIIVDANFPDLPANGGTGLPMVDGSTVTEHVLVLRALKYNNTIKWILTYSTSYKLA